MSSTTVIGRLVTRPVAVLSGGWLLLVVVASAVPTWFAGHDPLAQDLPAALQGPSAQHPLGTDMLGRDLLSRLVHGGAESVWGVLVALVVALVVGVSLGLIAGMYGRVVDGIISRSADVLFALPSIVILLVVVTIFPSNITVTMIFFGVLTAPGLIRIVRSAALATREEQFMAAAQVAGLAKRQILVRHLLPRIGSLVIVQASLVAALALVLQSGLGFLGFGAQPPQPSWGSLISDALTMIGRHPWALVPPGMAIGLTALALALLGDAVRDATTAGWATSKLASAPRSRRSTQRIVSVSASPDPLASVDSPELFSLQGLTVQIPIGGQATTVVENVSFSVGAGQTLGIVGESGCGKSVSVLSVLGMAPGGGQVVSGSCLFQGLDLFAMTPERLQGVRGRQIGYVSQEPSTSLDPTCRIGTQIVEAVRRHTGLDRRDAVARAVELLTQVRLPRPEQVMRLYPHQVSGGMAQRIAIAFALAGEPRLLIADEPTTALDVTVQAEILGLLRSLSQERDMAVIIVTHDWGVVADLCDRAVVMYAGQVVESGTVDELFVSPQHPYTHGLLLSNPALAGPDTKRLPTISGQVPRPGEWADGCRFAPRCEWATPQCSAEDIELDGPVVGHAVRCVRPGVMTREEALR